MFTSLSHVSIVVPDLAAAARRLRETYGLVVGEPRTNAEQGVRLAYVDLGNAKIELMEPSRVDSPIANFLARNPKGGIHHFSLNVDDMSATSGALSGQGVRILGDGRRQYNVSGERIAFIHPADFLGALVELEEQHTSQHATPHGEERREATRLEPSAEGASGATSAARILRDASPREAPQDEGGADSATR
jgi:methylmalonyl-CoA/ethylmalonyl-CoA epimerase